MCVLADQILQRARACLQTSQCALELNEAGTKKAHLIIARLSHPSLESSVLAFQTPTYTCCGACQWQGSKDTGIEQLPLGELRA